MLNLLVLVSTAILVATSTAAQAVDPDDSTQTDVDVDALVTADTNIAKPLPGTAAYEWLQFENPPDWIVDHDSGKSPDPNGTQWEDVYRSLIQSDQSAVAQGLPSHEKAIAAIDESASGSNGQTQQHKAFVLFVKHRSEGQRPESATQALREMFGRLIHRQLNSRWKNQSDEPALPFNNDSDLTIHRAVVYGNSDSDSQVMDAYLVSSSEPTPVLLEFHGGGWRRGRRNMLTQYKGGLMRQILDAGISVVSVDYRLAPKYRFPAQMEDAARAVQFVRSQAENWNIDATRVAAIGGSAGGHLLSWVALNEDQARMSDRDPVARQSSRLNSFIVQWAPLDLTRINPRQLQRLGPRGADAATAFCSVLAVHPEYYDRPESRERIRAASPVYQVSPDDPPAFVMYGGTPDDFSLNQLPPVPDAIDDPHSYLHGVVLIEALDTAGVEYVPHIGPSVGRDPAVDNAAILSFLTSHFRVVSDTSGGPKP